ncbi:PTS sugar transporter subunit IIA [Schnuerera sp. xch1]|uniref:PTS sugar transporter subunit IIA n=1 Tax=Schnuerera sp. xch1 TaxID=2874283 RepID=UPI001CBE4277|nr:PTS sugar transporter subunit IIA [Schnuerera sp. xch1]MBZ2175513.1 PTS sugar transporter subunit IIA [Schnuerera sp. xch1]
MLLDLLNEETVKIYSGAKDWEDAGRIAGQPLLDNEMVEDRYIDAMIDSVKKYGPYIVIAPGIALFHARPEDGVKTMCISLAVFKKGIIFNAQKNDPVKLVFVLGAIDSESHLQVLSEAMLLLQDSSAVNSIIASNDESEIIRIIKNVLA